MTLKIAPPTLAELCASAASANVSAALKKQLNILAAAATAASVVEKQNELLPSLMNMLGQAVDLVDGLQHNTGIDAAARPKLEQNLTDSLALFNDFAREQSARLTFPRLTIIVKRWCSFSS